MPLRVTSRKDRKVLRRLKLAKKWRPPSEVTLALTLAKDGRLKVRVRFEVFTYQPGWRFKRAQEVRGRAMMFAVRDQAALLSAIERIKAMLSTLDGCELVKSQNRKGRLEWKRREVFKVMSLAAQVKMNRAAQKWLQEQAGLMGYEVRLDE